MSTRMLPWRGSKGAIISVGFDDDVFGSEEMERQIDSMSEPGPYLLAGHSFGGPVVRFYAGAHPAEVGGLVLVDALSEDLWNGLSPKKVAVYEEINAATPGTHLEDLDHPAIFRQLREAPPAPTVPTVVLTADRPPLPLTKDRKSTRLNSSH